ncbi:hypothetical protein HYC85_015274 [Camellia sinensis]|uniref:Uncharacterized protein n=1 Tax=Camellia sinensis TaxID=4442 RepID=A0A7J7H005_CAMSI|nr:hypothetical protein HYC85_015274 [Camellia sinensis]
MDQDIAQLGFAEEEETKSFKDVSHGYIIQRIRSPRTISHGIANRVRPNKHGMAACCALKIFAFNCDWNPPNLEQVSKDMVDQYFSPLSEFEPGLELPIKQRETFT